MLKTHRYLVPLNEPEGNGSVTADVLTMTGNRRTRRKEWIRYLNHRVGETSNKEASLVAKKMGFKDLV